MGREAICSISRLVVAHKYTFMSLSRTRGQIVPSQLLIWHFPDVGMGGSGAVARCTIGYILRCLSI